MDFLDLGLVHPAPVMRAQPLAPSVQMQPPVLLHLVPGSVGIPDKDQVRIEPLPRQRPRELRHPHPQPPGL